MIVVTGSNGDLPLATSALAVLLWGYFLYVGVVDPFGGIWTLWPLFGTANQMLAAIALTLCTVVLFKMKRERYALVTLAPATWLVACTTAAGLEKVFSGNPNVGFISHALKYGDALCGALQTCNRPKLHPPGGPGSAVHRSALHRSRDT